MSFLSNLLRKTSPSQPSVETNSAEQCSQIIPNGQLLSNRYHVSELLGRGAMGEVYLAEDNVLGGVSVAIKVISRLVPSQALQDKFSREAQICAFLGHHNVNIVRVLDFGVHNGKIPYYVMEYVYGATLAEEISRRPLAVDRCLRLMSQVCAGLQGAHQGVLIDKKLYCVLHRDLKPGNIFITSNSSFGEIAKILDFGIAESFRPNHSPDSTEAMGTLAYASSEQLAGKKLEPSADIYSLGVTMFEALTGKLPIQPKRSTIAGWIEAHNKQSPRRLREAAPHLNVPESLEDLIQKCLAKRPSDRPQTIQEVLDRLQDISKSIGADLPIKTQSQEDALEALFNEVDQHAPQPPAAFLPVSTATIADDHQPQQTLLDIQPSMAPRSQTRRLAAEPLALVKMLAWPKEKPQAEIVFAQDVRLPELEQAALWVMLKGASQQYESLPHHRIEFAVEFDPHPMLAWVTILHDHQGAMRCLPCYLDLVDPQRKLLIQHMVQQGHFMFLLFDVSNPQRPVKTASLAINGRQQRFLHQSVIRASQVNSDHKPAAIAASKEKLKSKYAALKAKLPQRLAVKP